MKENVVSLNVAMLAKEKGFDYRVENFYLYDELYMDVNPKGNYNSFSWVKTWRNTDTDDTISAPTQSLLQRWLRDQHKIIVVVDFWNEGTNWVDTTYQSKVGKFIKLGIQDRYTGNGYSKYEEALENGLQEALKLIEICENN